ESASKTSTEVLHLERSVRIVSAQVKDLGRRFAGRLEKDHCLIAGAKSADVKQFVFLFVNEVVLIRSQHVPEKLVASFGDRVFSDVEKCFVVGGPGDGVDALDLFGKQLARSQVFDLQRVLAITGVVSGVGEQV